MSVAGMIYPESGKCVEIKRKIKFPLCILFFFLSLAAFGQSNFRSTYNIDLAVQQTDSLFNKSQKIFYLNKPFPKDMLIKETWYYTIKDGKVNVFQVQYIIDSTEFIETYYLNNDRLIYSEEFETVYYSDYEDEMTYGRICYFINRELRQVKTLGRKKVKYQEWGTATETLTRFDERFAELKMNLR
jgi:hypothetical protein